MEDLLTIAYDKSEKDVPTMLVARTNGTQILTVALLHGEDAEMMYNLLTTGKTIPKDNETKYDELLKEKQKLDSVVYKVGEALQEMWNRD